MPADPCPWLGAEADRRTRHTEPVEAHLCYAQKGRPNVALDYQAQFCLIGAHRDCPFYLEPPAPPPAPKPLVAEEDEVGPPPGRLSAAQVLLWLAVIVATVVVAFYFGSTVLGPVSTATPTATMPTPSPVLTATPSPTLILAQVSPSVKPGLGRDTATPTPYPGGAIRSLSPQAGAGGWVASDEARGNHLGDSYLYAGVFQGVSYHGIFQLDLSAVPRGATIHAAVLELTGLDGNRLGSSGVWEVRVLDRQADEGWSRHTFQEVHNAAVQWTLPPALAASDLSAGGVNAFALSPEQLQDLEQRLLDEHYTVFFRLDGPLAGENSLFAWDSGYGPVSQGSGPRLVLNVGPPPQTPIPTGSPQPTSTPTPTDTPEWFVVTSTPTPANAMTAAAVALRETAWATTTGTTTPLPQYVATATPRYVVVTNTPTPANNATAAYLLSLATANVVLTGTPTPTPDNLATATYTPLPPPPTRTPVYVWWDEPPGARLATPTPTTPPIPPVLRGKILFLSDRGEQSAVYMLDPDSGRVGILTARWPYEVALQKESISPDGQAKVYVQNDGRGVPQVYIHSAYYGSSWQVTFTSRMSYDPVWSPDGGQLALVSAEPGNDEIYVVDADGKNLRRLTFNQWEWDKHPSWSPKGASPVQIVFWSNEGSGRRQLWIMNADGTGRRRLLDSPYNDWDPVWVK